MTRKHYEAIAAAIREESDAFPTDLVVRGTLERLASALGGVFAADNPRFDRARFLAACGIGE